MRSKVTKRLVLSAMFLALCLVLPFLTGQIPEIGSALSPMHIPVLICGFVCGGYWGAAVGFIAPFLRYMIFQMPPMPMGIAMAAEMTVYGLVAGLLYKKLPKNIGCMYISLVSAMLLGRVVWGIVRFLMAGLGGSEFSMAAFWAGGITGAIPGIILQILIIPVIVMALKRAKLIEK